MRRMYFSPELLELDCILPKYVKSSTESTLLLSTIIGDGIDPEPRFWSFVLVQETRRLTLGSFFIHCCKSGAEAFLLVNKQIDVVSIVNVRESELANLDADFATDTIHNIVHHFAKQGGSQGTSFALHWRSS